VILTDQSVHCGFQKWKERAKESERQKEREKEKQGGSTSGQEKVRETHIYTHTHTYIQNLSEMTPEAGRCTASLMGVCIVCVCMREGERDTQRKITGKSKRTRGEKREREVLSEMNPEAGRRTGSLMGVCIVCACMRMGERE